MSREPKDKEVVPLRSRTMSIRQFFGPIPGLKELNLICWGLFFAFLILPLMVVVIGRYRQSEPLLQNPEVDFIYVYGAGKILLDGHPDELYNYETELKTFTAIHPLQRGKYGPYRYPPFVAILFRPLALLPLTTAYWIWMATSLILYLTGLLLLCWRFFRGDHLRQLLIVCLSLSFYPYINWTLLSGHVSIIGFLAFAATLTLEDQRRPFWSGLVLSACLYKPTFLFLLLPLLVIGRRWKNLFGLATGAAILAIFSTIVEGFRVWSGFLGGLLSFGVGSAAIHSRTFKELWKYVDLASFLSAERGFLFWVCFAAAIIFAGWSAWQLIRMWWTSSPSDQGLNTIIWGATLTLTLVLNVYVPIYDSIIVVVAVISASGTLRRLGAEVPSWFTVLWLLILVCSWFTVSMAEKTGFQIITILLALLGQFQLLLASRSANLHHAGRLA